MTEIMPMLFMVCGVVGAVGWGQPRLLGSLCGALFGATIGGLTSMTSPWVALSAVYLLIGVIYSELGFLRAGPAMQQATRHHRLWIRHLATVIVFVGLVLLWPAHWAWWAWSWWQNRGDDDGPD